MVQEEGFHDHKDRAEVDQEAGVWVQGVGVEPPEKEQTDSKLFDE